MSPSLSVVANNARATPLLPKSETVAQRVQSLQAEAKQLAKDHIHTLTTAMADLEQLAAEIAAGGEAYAPGVRDVARRLAEDLESRIQTVRAIDART